MEILTGAARLLMLLSVDWLPHSLGAILVPRLIVVGDGVSAVSPGAMDRVGQGYVMPGDRKIPPYGNGKDQMVFNRRAQSMIEYTIIVGIVMVVLYYMGTSIKRGVQSLVKVTADQVGNQQNSDQDFTDYQQGYLIGSNTVTQENRWKQTSELGYIPASGSAIYAGNTSFNEASYTMTSTVTNGGFTPTN